jgi:hypothetical protein
MNNARSPGISAVRPILPGRRQAFARIARRIASCSLPAVAVAALGAATLVPALASTGPSMNVDGNNVNITVAGHDDSLKFYWAVNGTPTWHPEQVARPGSVS